MRVVTALIIHLLYTYLTYLYIGEYSDLWCFSVVNIGTYVTNIVYYHNITGY